MNLPVKMAEMGRGGSDYISKTPVSQNWRQISSQLHSKQMPLSGAEKATGFTKVGQNYPSVQVFGGKLPNVAASYCFLVKLTPALVHLHVCS